MHTSVAANRKNSTSFPGKSNETNLLEMIQNQGMNEVKKTLREKLENGPPHHTGRNGEPELRPASIQPIFLRNKYATKEILITKGHEVKDHSMCGMQLRQKFSTPKGRAKANMKE